MKLLSLSSGSVRMLLLAAALSAGAALAAGDVSPGVWPPAAPARPYRMRRRGQAAEYWDGQRMVWSLAFAPKQLTIRSQFVGSRSVSL